MQCSPLGAHSGIGDAGTIDVCVCVACITSFMLAEFEDMLTVSDSLPYLVKMVCSNGSNLEQTVLSGGLDVEPSRFQAELPVRRSINEDPNVYEWKAKAEDVYRSLNQYCL